MAEDATAGANPLLSGLPDEIVTWEILVRLDPKSVLRCRAVRRDWRRVTSTRRFLLANHSRQPTLPIFDTGKFIGRVHYRIILTFDHRAANNTWRNKGLNLTARLDKGFHPVASCDGLLVLSKYNRTASGTCLSICNPATREHAFLGPPWDFKLLGMYSHRPTGEYRLLLKRWSFTGCLDSPKDRIGFYVFTLGSNQTPRYIGWPETASWCIHVPVMVRDCLHWYPTFYLGGRGYLSESKPVIVFDTIAESLRQMRAPIVPTDSYIFEMDGTLGIHNHNRDTQVMDIWVLQNYEREIWDFKYHIKLPFTEMSTFGGSDEHWDVDVVSRDGDLLFLVSFGRCLLHVAN
ncbi:hypothetical protein CFC21_043998 [Triticum aestivum]|uniref:F-box associated beta-propeller type 3 domain-containing protein n=2 Tax=Triticum aestivum TaxID=4565 RepID=A0A3B6FW20_WHEAT|nr:hypothetical protein CFC21_043998 [Triticum aestivum]